MHINVVHKFKILLLISMIWLNFDLTYTVYSKSKIKIDNNIDQKSPPKIIGKYALVLDLNSDKILYKKKIKDKVAVASTQKLLTGLIILETGNLDELVTIKGKKSIKTGIKVGEKYSREDLLKLLFIKSSNNIANSLAIDNSGSISSFVKKMNDKAKSLGMLDSNFKNPHGLTEKNQYSTAYDLSLLAKKCYEVPFIRDVVRMKSIKFRLNSGLIKNYENTNQLLADNELCTGMKTGSTYASGYCLISSGEKKVNDIIKERLVIILNSTKENIFKDSNLLLNWALDN